MANRGTRSRAAPTAARDEHGKFAITPEADLTWLLHRAAQSLRAAVDEECHRNGVQLRDYIVLSALRLEANLTQLELARALALDKTTLTVQLDHLEQEGLVVRRPDPRDRRSRLPKATRAGRTVQARVASALARLEKTLLARFALHEQRTLRLLLCRLIEDVEAQEPVKGSCL